MINLVNVFLSPLQKSTGEESPPILTKHGSITNAIVEIQLPRENEVIMPSLKIEEPSSPYVLPDANKIYTIAEECVCVHEDDTTMEVPTQPVIKSKNNSFSSEEDSSDGSVGCVEVKETEKKGLFVFWIL